MLILVINCGSSSVKYQVIDIKENKSLVTGIAERIGIPGSKIKQQLNGGGKFKLEKDLADHKEAIQQIFNLITDKEHGAIGDMSQISAVGHRVVHGGEKFNRAVVIDDEVLKVLESLFDLAPLHNPPNVLGIKTCQALLPHAPQVAVFDTAFHQTLPDYAYTYALPYEYYERLQIRKYGFHGTSHKYVSNRVAEILGKPIGQLKIIVCHLGNGSSITAVDQGKSVDTTMGFTPLAGVPMGTRSGDIDPAIIPFIMKKENFSAAEVSTLLNKQSGVLGISGLSSDFRDLEEAAEKGNQRAILALNTFNYSVKKAIGAFSAAMGGVDVVAFTGGIGENGIDQRRDILQNMSYLGLELDNDKNNCRGKEAIISKEGSKVLAMVVPTNEELMIAKETAELI
ncbi:acetate/propionate family kinase [Desulfofalx alkaliphila]|uniref:acetate/propionate family kinase n=1 Tax=Desulfofalx alkaliphila TaxID=105483 RepID=UPI0004E20FD8|nr:acetate kinase [Desulfofalx alkaliphila]